MNTFTHTQIVTALIDLSTTGPLEDGTYRFTGGALERVSFSRGYQVATEEISPLGAELEEGDMIGAWTNDEGIIVIDHCTYIDGSKSLAIVAGRAFAQDAIWDWKNTDAITL